jgi:hypothetical protein
MKRLTTTRQGNIVYNRNVNEICSMTVSCNCSLSLCGDRVVLAVPFSALATSAACLRVLGCWENGTNKWYKMAQSDLGKTWHNKTQMYSLLSGNSVARALRRTNRNLIRTMSVHCIKRNNNTNWCRLGDTSQTEDEAQGTFSLNCINATIVYQYYSPWRWPSRVRNMWETFKNKIIYIFGALVGVIISNK